MADQPEPQAGGGLSTSTSDSCVFCDIVAGQLAADIVYSDEKFLVFKDHKPDAEVHLLVIPRAHVHSLQSLKTPADLAMLDEMIALGEQVLAADLEPRRFGFHRPPFISVGHLHLHLLGGPWKRLLSGLSFTPLAPWWFWDAAKARQHVASLAAKHEAT